MILPSSCLSTVISFRPFSPHSLLTRLARLLFHLLAQTQRPHVRPNLFDVREALRFRARLARIVPTKRVLTIGRPDRILLFVVHHNFVDGSVFSFVATHFLLLV